jgi:hypothetical protein
VRQMGKRAVKTLRYLHESDPNGIGLFWLIPIGINLVALVIAIVSLRMSL